MSQWLGLLSEHEGSVLVTKNVTSQRNVICCTSVTFVTFYRARDGLEIIFKFTHKSLTGLDRVRF